MPNMLREEWIRMTLEDVAPRDHELVDALLWLEGSHPFIAARLEEIARALIVAAHKLRTTEP